jgi:hypothetical protein
MYHLAFEVKGAVITAAQGWRVLMNWGSLLGVSMLAASPQLTPFELGTAGDFLELWRKKVPHDPRRCSCSRAGGGLDFRGVL